jgi:hypothetical protein
LIEQRVQETPTLEMMERFHAYEAVWEFNPELELHPIDPFPGVLWKCWHWHPCRVRGRVVRPVDVGGTIQNLPVCHVRVHVCEVDRWPWLIARLPDPLIFRLRDEFLWPRPLPDPPPYRFLPRLIDPSPENLAQIQRTRSPLGEDLEATFFNPQPEPPRFAEVQFPAENRSTLGPQPEPPDLPTLQAELAPPLQAALRSRSATVVRRALIDHRDLLLPYICHWPWLWSWYHCDPLTVLETDPQGRFDTTIWYLCGGDKPDLYFWIEACIGGSWETVYNPPIACNTYWNYACGSDVTLTVTDPRVPVCNEPPDLAGLQVSVMSIGNNVSISEIGSDGLTSADEPFGGVLEPHVWFSRAALIAAGITHYKWSYTRLTDADGNTVSDSWHDLDREVIRHYAQIEQTPPDYPLSFPAYTLGPDPAFGAKNLFQIQPIDVPVTPPAGSTITGWAPLDARQDSAHAFFRTHLLNGGDALAAAGKYRLKFELFDSSGNLVNFTDEGVLLKEATDPAPFGTGTVNTSTATIAHTVKDGTGKTIGFQVDLWIDNNPCEAEIFTIDNAGLTVNTPCGFIKYEPGAGAQLRFRAYHPNDHADFRFETYRGPSIKVAPASAPDTPALSGWAKVDSVAVNGFIPDASRVYSKWVPVNTLLTSNKPPATADCVSAAFAETLYVDARAQDGWSTLHYLDAQATPIAFALDPAPAP